MRFVVFENNGPAQPDCQYRTAVSLGANCCGVVYEITSAGQELELYTFTGLSDGGSPEAGLTSDCGGNLYGTALLGTFGYGVIFKLTHDEEPEDANCVVTITGSPQQPITINGQGNFVAMVTITNNGNVTISSAQVAIAGTTLGSASLLSAPLPITNLAPGASAQVTLTFPPTAMSNGATSAPLKVSGTYTVTSPPLNGNWAFSFRSVSL